MAAETDSVGAKVIKVQECEQWIGVNFLHLTGLKDGHFRQDTSSGRMYLEVAFPKGLVPLQYYVDDQLCTYMDPNIWLHHDLSLGNPC